MMEQRITTINKTSFPQYAQGSPLLLSAYALHLDNVDKQYIAQLKWINISDTPIQAVMVELTCFDSFGHQTATHSYQYDRLSASKGTTFGAQTAIALGNEKIAKYQVALKAVSFDDGTIQEFTPTLEYKQLPSDIPHSMSPELLAQYHRDLRKQEIKTTVRVNLQKADGLWQCACGSWQLEGSSCLSCSAKYEDLLQLTEADILTLTAHLNEYIEKQEAIRKDNIYYNAIQKMSGESIADYEAAIKLLESIPGWKDAEDQTERCKVVIGELQSKQEAEKREKAISKRKEARKRKICTLIVAFSITAIAAGIYLFNIFIMPEIKYNSAIALKSSGNPEEAIAAFEALEGYKDSTQQIIDCKYDAAIILKNSGSYNEAIIAFINLNGYKDSVVQIKECRYNMAMELMNMGNYKEALTQFQIIKPYKDSIEKIDAILGQK